ncbi:MAG: branched-chain amino acid ABC transporter permease [Firmicutes bacterium]|nr:branched-chain amino acid ABC transporter permease [Bacillota bacterium]
MAEFLQQLVNGISLGSIYALIALGYTMVYGIIKLINFAHGDVMMVGAYVGLFATAVLGLDVFMAMLLAMVVCAVLGVVIERLAYKPLRHSTRIAALITAIGVSLFLEYIMVWGVGPQQRTYPTGTLTDASFRIFNGQVTVTSKDMVTLLVSLGLTVILTYIVHRTRIGKAMRAVSYDGEAAMLMGINVNSTISATFAIGSALAAAAGVLIGVYYNSVDPLMGIIPGLKAFVAAVLGGIGIIPGALLGSYLMGIVEAFVSGYGSSMYRDAVAFGILILILIIKPVGLLGKNVGEKV